MESLKQTKLPKTAQEEQLENELSRYDAIIGYYEKNPSRLKSSQNIKYISEVYREVANKFSSAYQKARKLANLSGINPDVDSEEISDIAECAKLPEILKILGKINLSLLNLERKC